MNTDTPMIEDALDNERDYNDEHNTPTTSSLILAVSNKSALARLAWNLDDVWENGDYGHGEDTFFVRSHFVEWIYGSAIEIEEGDWADKAAYSIYIGAEALDAIDKTLLAAEERGEFNIRAASSLGELSALCKAAFEALPAGTIAVALASIDSEAQVFYSTQRASQGQLASLSRFERHVTMGDLTNGGAYWDLYLTVSLIAGGVGLAAGRAADENAPGANKHFVDATSIQLGYVAALLGVGADNVPSLQLSEGIARLVRILATLPNATHRPCTKLRELKHWLAFGVAYAKGTNKLDQVEQHGRMGTMLDYFEILPQLMRLAPTSDRRASLERIAQAVGISTTLANVNDVSLLESKLASDTGGISFLLQGLERMTFSDVIEKIHSFTSVRSNSGGGAAEISVAQGSAGLTAATMTSNRVHGPALQARIKTVLAAPAVIEAIETIETSARVGGLDASDAVLEAVAKSRAPALWSLLLYNKPAVLSSLHTFLSGVYPSRRFLGRAFSTAIANAQSTPGASSGGATGGPFAGGPAQVYTADPAVVTAMAAGAPRMDALCIEFSKALSAEKGETSVVMCSFFEWLTLAGRLDFFNLYLAAALPVIGLEPGPILELMSQCRAVMALVGDGEGEKERVAEKLVEAIDADFDMLEMTRKAAMENLEVTFQPVSFDNTNKLLSLLHSNSRLLAQINTIFPGAAKMLRAGSSSGSSASDGDGAPAAKARKTGDVKDVVTSSEKLNALPLYRDDEKVRTYGDNLICVTQARVRVYDKGVVTKCVELLKGEGKTLGNKILRLDALLSHQPRAEDRAKAAANLKHNHVVTEPAGWAQKRMAFLKSDFTAPPRN